MSRPCDLQATGTIELYFYDELDTAARQRVERHLPGCAPCRTALDELNLIRSALAARPDIASPPAGDWSGFMARLDRRLRPVAERPIARTPERPLARSYRGYLAMAALLALVTMSVVWVARSRGPLTADRAFPVEPAPDTQAVAPRAALAAASEQHLERSKLVLLGLTAKDANAASPEEWTYERELASNLLNDTRLYRMAAEERGMDSLAGVLRDLEVVLLQTSFTEADDEALGQIQRLIRKRDLLEKMNVVTSSGI